ncbi:PolC-type DNA polymerase III [Mycoplasma sp. Pen4]|uniref:PolC-type DNA polymerase III n=1 Tax=Mycoplasma sp. Pen4 TaxID=640330 RepID=UPI0016542D00|nr:PolC-type DNA polymerase III [Mycoplasma sp. Pen4]QNM93689.1 PolC-type DNA polymerase III [Mycoplasma sp. Pen4]
MHQYSNKYFEKLTKSLNMDFLSSFHDAEFDPNQIILVKNPDGSFSHQALIIKLQQIPDANEFAYFLKTLKNNKYRALIEIKNYDPSDPKNYEILKAVASFYDYKLNREILDSISFHNNCSYNNQLQTWEFNVFDKQKYQQFQKDCQIISLIMKDLGFKEFQLNSVYKTVEVNNINLEESIRQNYKKIQFDFTDEVQGSSNNGSGFQKSNYSSTSNTYRKNTRNINYSKCEISYINNLEYEVENVPVTFTGLVYKYDVVDRPDFKIHKFNVADAHDAIEITLFENNRSKANYVPKIGDDVEVYGMVTNPFNRNATGKTVKANYFVKLDDQTSIKVDEELNRRIELSTRSKMSTMDGLLSPSELVQIAKKLGHKAIALVDANGVQGFPEFTSSAKKAGIKPIYGVSFDVVDKNHNFLLNYNTPSLENIETAEYVVFDIETTSLSAQYGEIIEFGASIVRGGNIVDTIQFFIKASKPLEATTINLTNITDQMLADDGYEIDKGLDKIYEILNNRVCVAHNASFDMNFVIQKLIQYNKSIPNSFFVDSLIISQYLFSDKQRHNLGRFCSYLDVVYDEVAAHRADYDANVLAQAWIKSIQLLKERGVITFDDLDNVYDEKIYQRTRSSQITVLALDQDGLKQLFQLVSLSLTQRYFGSPKLFFEDIEKNEHLLVGSGGLKSELIDANFYLSDLFIEKLIQKFDYIEIPHPNALKHLLGHDGFTLEEIQKSLKKLIELSLKYNKIPVAIGDVRYESTNDEEVFKCLVYSKGIGNTSHFLFDFRKANAKTLKLPDLSYYTTTEMLEQFAFLNNPELIEQVVVTNTQKIADKVADDIIVIRDKLYTPVFDDSKNKLYELVYKTAHEKYGEVLPTIIEERIKKELTPIIDYGFDVIYWISHKLVKKSNDNGYLVGSRGSVGSSIVALLSGISEINPLPPHYICAKCKNFELVEIPGVTSGFDLDDKKCPNCNITMDKDGQTIPFETFLGFNADKVPDIDLNFSGDYQAEIHNEIKRLFGENHTFRAGTVSTIKDKTAFGYVKKANEEYGFGYSNTYVDYIASRMVGVKRTTSQHPGGIIIIPKKFDVEDFTPINYPANDIEIDWLTTHFDFHAIHDNVLKLDILGHVDPTAIKMLERLTNINVKTDIPKKDPKVISIFRSTEALNIRPEQIGGEPTGSLGLPEFGTSFVRKMLKEANAQSFADLISLSGLSHGESVWTGNAQSLINERGFTLKDVISCRDDIMDALIKMGVDSLFSFKIMEQVRKGKGINPEQEAKLKESNVPDWYIESCKKIKYMFPKAHAAAYVLMAWRIAWFKVYYPLEYYATFFTTRVEEFDLAVLKNDHGGVKINKKIKELEEKRDKSVKENNLLQTLEIARELYARGFTINNIDITKSLATEWVVDHDHKCLIPPFSVVGGLGVAVANKIIAAREEVPFISKEDFKQRSGVNSSLYKVLDEEFGVLDLLDETNQMSLF